MSGERHPAEQMLLPEIIFVPGSKILDNVVDPLYNIVTKSVWIFLRFDLIFRRTPSSDVRRFQYREVKV